MVILGGMFAYSKLQTSLFPEITFPKIKVIADAGLQPVGKMMVTVTKPLENAIKQVPDLQFVRSTTSRGSCEISAFMDWNANIDLSQQRARVGIDRTRGPHHFAGELSTGKFVESQFSARADSHILSHVLGHVDIDPQRFYLRHDKERITRT